MSSGLPVNHVKRIVKEYGFKFEGTERQNCTNNPMTTFLIRNPGGSDLLVLQGPLKKTGKKYTVGATITPSEELLRESLEAFLDHCNLKMPKTKK